MSAPPPPLVNRLKRGWGVPEVSCLRTYLKKTIWQLCFCFWNYFCFKMEVYIKLREFLYILRISYSPWLWVNIRRIVLKLIYEICIPVRFVFTCLVSKKLFHQYFNNFHSFCLAFRGILKSLYKCQLIDEKHNHQ